MLDDIGNLTGPRDLASRPCSKLTIIACIYLGTVLLFATTGPGLPGSARVHTRQAEEARACAGPAGVVHGFLQEKTTKKK